MGKGKAKTGQGPRTSESETTFTSEREVMGKIITENVKIKVVDRPTYELAKTALKQLDNKLKKGIKLRKLIHKIFS